MRTYWTVRDIGNCGLLLAVRDTMAVAQQVASGIEREFDRECGVAAEEFDEDELPEEYSVNMTSIERESLCNLVVAADVCCPEQVTDAVLETCEQEGYASALKAIAKFKANDPAERRALGIE
jgi:hypothetical protein